MSTDNRIKVVKLAERKRRAKARVKKGLGTAAQRAQEKEREAAATVTGWVDELRGQKNQGADALSAFNDLFDDEP